MMSESRIKGKYLEYLLSRMSYPYEDIPNDKTLNYTEFKNKLKGVK